jgi:ATP phosphoribosyltransferase regulatory subunit
MIKILPIGFRDLIGKEALFHQKIINQLLQDFSKNEYTFIKPSLVEFGDGGNFSFQAKDLHSGKNIVVRNDITLQIQRLLQTSFVKAKFPLRICYSGEIINLHESQLLYRNVKRQTTQVGLEIIGREENSLSEVIEQTIDSIKKFKPLEELILEISPVGFFQEIADDLDFEINDETLKAVLDKNISFFLKSKIPHKEIIAELLLAKDFDEIGELLKKLSISQQSLIKFHNLQKLSQNICSVFDKYLQINIDIFNQENSYHKNIAFDILDKTFTNILAKGGEYKINEFDAVGATIYVDEFLNYSL